MKKPSNSMEYGNGRIEVFEKEMILVEYKSTDEYSSIYQTHIDYGASGSYRVAGNIGIIWSYKTICQKLEKKGYKNLNFCNGGDDDILIVDHDNKCFGFFENPTPPEDALNSVTTLEKLWKEW